MDEPKGHVELLLLAALEDGDAHGYGLVESLKDRSEGVFELAEGTIYPALYRLERRRHVTSSWEVVGGRRRRIYRLTRSGRAELVRQRSEWHVFSRAVESVLA